MGFVEAIPVAIKVAGMVSDGYKYVKQHPDEVQQAMEEAAKAATAAKRIAGDAKDYLEVDEHLAKAKTAADRARTMAADTASNITADRSMDPEMRSALAEAKKAEEEAAKAIAEARQAVLESATIRIPLIKLGEELDTLEGEELVRLMETLESPGCYVIASYGKNRLGKDLTKYRGIYVGSDEVVGDGIAQAVSRAGNPDVYADIKYRQNVVIYIYSCTVEELKYRGKALIEALGALNSYNAPIG